jgi:hypothetical protein
MVNPYMNKKFFNELDLKNCIKTKEEMYKELNGKRVDVHFTQFDGIGYLFLVNEDGITYCIDELKETK